MLAISVDETIEEIEHRKGQFTLYLDQDNNVNKSYKVEHTPSVFVLDEDRKILASSEGEAASEELIKDFISRNQK